VKNKPSSLSPNISKFFHSQLSQYDSKWLNISCAWNIVAGDLQPMLTVDRMGYHNFMFDINSTYRIPGRKTLTKILSDYIFPFCEMKMRKEISYFLSISANKKIAGSIDVWSSRANRPYVGIVCNYIDWTCWKRKKSTLACCEFADTHTGANHVQKISDIVKRLDIDGIASMDDFFGFMTHDNAANVVAGLRDHSTVTPIRCARNTFELTPCHVLRNETSDNYFAEAAAILTKVRRIVTHFSHSNKTKYEDCARIVGEPIRKLVQSCDTRWHSELDMLNSVLEHPMTIKMVKVQKPAALFFPLTDDEQSKAEEMVAILYPFKQAEKCLEGDLVPLSKYWTVYSMLLKSLNETTDLLYTAPDGERVEVMADDICQFTKTLKSKLLTDLKDNINGKMTAARLRTILVASFLDPRYKKLRFLSKEARSRALSEIDLSDEWKELQGDNHIIDNGLATSKDSTLMSSGTDRNCAISSFLSSIDGGSSSEEEDDIEANGWSLSQEIDVYKRIHSIDAAATDEDVLLWWRDQGISHYGLHKLGYMASTYLAIMTSSANVERLFSVAGRLVSPRRTRLSSSMIEGLVLTNQNMHLCDNGEPWPQNWIQSRNELREYLPIKLYLREKRGGQAGQLSRPTKRRRHSQSA